MTGQNIVTFLNSLGFPRDDSHVWGYQLRVVNIPLADFASKSDTEQRPCCSGYAAKFLIFTNSLPGSLHTHKDEKDETFICLAGKVWIECPDSVGCIMNPGDVFNIPHFTSHRSRALEYPAVVLEVSTEDSDDFTHRL